MSDWKMIRVPTDLHARLVRHVAEIEAARERGQAIVPGEFADGVPLHHAIARLLDEVEARRGRSRKPRRRSEAGAVGHVYMPPSGRDVASE